MNILSLFCAVTGSIFFHWFLQVHMSFPNVDQFINLLVSVPANGHENSFAYVMTEWTKQQGKHLYSRYLVVWFSLSTWCITVRVFLAISTYGWLRIYIQGRYKGPIKSKSHLQLSPCYCPLDILNSRRSLSQAVRFRSYAIPFCFFFLTKFTTALQKLEYISCIVQWWHNHALKS